jgi:hypothetical protein
MMFSDRALRKADNKAAYAASRQAFDQLPQSTKDQIKADFAAERARNSEISWAKYIAVILPLLPADAR